MRMKTNPAWVAIRMIPNEPKEKSERGEEKEVRMRTPIIAARPTTETMTGSPTVMTWLSCEEDGLEAEGLPTRSVQRSE